MALLALGGWGDVLPMAVLLNAFINTTDNKVDIHDSLISSAIVPSPPPSAAAAVAVATLSSTAVSIRFITHEVYRARLNRMFGDLWHHPRVHLHCLDIPIIHELTPSSSPTAASQSSSSESNPKRQRVDTAPVKFTPITSDHITDRHDNDEKVDKQLDEMKMLYGACVGSSLIIINPCSLIGVHIAEAINYHNDCKHNDNDSGDANSNGKDGKRRDECRVMGMSYGMLPSHTADTSSMIRDARIRWPILFTRLQQAHCHRDANNDTKHDAKENDITNDACVINMDDINHWLAPLWNDAYVAFREWAGLSSYWLSECNTTDTPLPLTVPLIYGVSPVLMTPPSYWPRSVYISGHASCPVPRHWKCPSYVLDFINKHSTTMASASASSSPTSTSPDHPVGICYIGFGSMTSSIIGSVARRLGQSCDDAVLFLRRVLSKAVSDVGMTAIVYGLALPSTPPAAAATTTAAGSVAARDEDPSTTPPPTTTTIDDTHMLWLDANDYMYDTWLYPYCRVIIHHGGAGTVTTAIRASRPQVICAYAFDQHWWSQRITYNGIGVTCSLWNLLSPSPPTSPLSSSLSLSSLMCTELSSCIVRACGRDMCAMVDQYSHQLDSSETSVATNSRSINILHVLQHMHTGMPPSQEDVS